MNSKAGLMNKKNKSILDESKDIQLAIELIQLGARLQLLESETALSRDRLVKLYKELRGVSPPKGMLPFSTDWFLSWQPNIHSSLYLGIYRQLEQNTELEGIHLTLKAYKIYLEQLPPEEGDESVLSLTRAWTLNRFISSNMLVTAKCKSCKGEFVAQPVMTRNYVCGLCDVPSRAGKTQKVIDEKLALKQAKDALEP
jgi:flagellar transcriptional activator FlhC